MRYLNKVEDFYSRRDAATVLCRKGLIYNILQNQSVET